MVVMFDSPDPTSVESLRVHQKVTAMVNRYVIHAGRGDEEGPILAIAQQKRLAFKELVTFYADEKRTTPIFAFKARSKFDVNAGHDVTDSDGQPLGWFKKDFRRSLTRSTWHLGAPALELEAVGTERSQGVAIGRRTGPSPGRHGGE